MAIGSEQEPVYNFDATHAITVSPFEEYEQVFTMVEQKYPHGSVAIALFHIISIKCILRALGYKTLTYCPLQFIGCCSMIC